MASTSHDTWSLGEDDVVSASLDEAQAHDAYWQQAHARENFFRPGLDYEDYAPAYCVGYVGYAQYGGDFADAEKCLISNWVRIKGDSRLGMDEARMAFRAAWDRAASPVAQSLPWSAYLQRLLVSANAWVERLAGQQHPAPRPIARRAQQGGLARH